MRRGIGVMGGVLGVLLLTSPVEASQFSNGLRKTWGYIFSPVNCAANWVSAVVVASGQFVQCVLNNANPGNLVP